MTYLPGVRMVVIVLVLTSAVLYAQDIVLGALEEIPGASSGDPSFRGVRILFHKDGNDWQAFPNDCPDQDCLEAIPSKYPAEVTWTVAFDGRKLGLVTGRTPKKFAFYSYVGLQKISSQEPVPSVGKKSTEYGGFIGEAVYRPLITNSQPYFKDPEAWRPSPLSASLVGLLRKQFRYKFPKLCKASEQDEAKLEPFLYRDEDIKLVKAYASKKGWTIARLHLEKAVACEDQESGFEIDDPWFTVTPQTAVQYLDAGMWLVDAGDYDNDGKSELIFSIDRYNRGGYELFYDDFKKHAVFQFGYH